MTADTAATHILSLAVWDLPSPIIIGERTRVKVGVSCSCGCELTGATIAICDEQGRGIATGRTASEWWPGTTSLHWVELAVAAFEPAGTHAWTVHASIDDPLHAHVEAAVGVVASMPPEHRMTIEVVERGTLAPLPGVELRVGAFSATTNEMGRAHVDVPGGTYDVHAWKLGYDVLSRSASVADDMTMRLEIPVSLPAEQPYWM